ncbi:hypothetical protein ACQ4PT_004756 [Festuca glaucescens]
MASGGDDLGEAGVGPETRRVHDWVPEGMELRFAFLVNIRRERFIVDAKDQKKFQGGFDYRLPMDCNLSFRQFGEVICGPYPWGLHDEVEFKYYDGESDWVKVSNDGELATMFAKHKEKGKFHVRLQNDVVVPALGPSRADSCRRNGSSSQNSSVRGASVSARRRGGLSSVGTGSRVPREVEPEYLDDEERLYSDVVQNLRLPCRAENRDEAGNDAFVIDDEEGEDEDLPPIEWDPENPQMEEGSIFASMSDCRNALVTYCIKAERAFEVDKSDIVRYRVHCPTEDCPWRMHASKMRNSTNVQVKVNPFRHTCLESTLRKETISRAKSRSVAEEVKRWVTENHQVGTKELQKKLKEKFKIEVPYMRVFNGKQHAMDSIYGNLQESFKLLYSFKGEVEKTSPGQAGNIQQYVHDYYSVARFKATYAHALPALEGKQQWDIVDPGFKLCPPALKRAAVDLAFGECFDAPNDEKNDEQSDEPNEDPMDATNDEQTDDQNEDPMEATSDDQIDDPIEAPNDEKIEDQIDDPIDDPIEASNDEQQNDQNDDPIDDPIEASNDEQIEAPNVGVQPSVVVSSTCSVVGSNKVVAVSSEVVKVLTTKRRRKEAMCTRGTRTKVVAMSTRITRSKVVARSTRTKKKPQRFVDD